MSEVTSEATTPGINIQDIVGLLNVVDVAARRGAFKAEEMTTVGALYDKVVVFLKSTGAIQDTPTEEPAPTETKTSKRSKKQ